MQFDKDTLIKHRFWILLIIVVPIILIVLIWLPASVGSSITTKQNDVEATKKSLNITDPKNQEWLIGLGKKEEKLVAKRDEVWRSAWQAQQDLYTWPADEEMRHLANAYFGDTINRHVCGKYKTRKYQLTQAQEILKIIKPVNSRGEGVVLTATPYPTGMRVLGDFKAEQPPSEELWLAQEDLWVQRELLQVVRDANDSVAVFRVLPNFAAAGVVGPAAYSRVPETSYWPAAEKNDKRQRFYNPLWELDLTLTTNERKDPVLKGTITNRSRRKLSLGMDFDVQLRKSRDESGAGVGHLHVDGEPLAAGKSMEIRERDQKSLKQAAPDGVFGVEQIFTWKTAPVKRLVAMALNHSSHRTANTTLKPARQFPVAEVKPAEPTGGETAAPGGGDLTIGIAGGGQQGGGGVTVPGAAGPATLRVTPSGLLRDRYIHVTEQVRRMPVALTVTVEQAHIPNVIAAFSNSKMRMQVTQVHMVHVPGASVRGPAEGAPTVGPELGGGVPKPGLPVPPGGRVGGGRDDEGTPEMGVAGGGRGGVPGLTGPGFPAPGLFGGETASEEESGNLVELTVYAIASLYERFPPRPPAPAGDAAAAKPATP